MSVMTSQGPFLGEVALGLGLGVEVTIGGPVTVLNVEAGVTETVGVYVARVVGVRATRDSHELL